MRTASGSVIAVILLLVVSTLDLLGADPVVSNVRASQRAGTELVDIVYDLADADSQELAVTVKVSGDGGITWDVPCTSVSGTGVGTAVTPGAGKSVVWDAGKDWGGRFSSQVRVEVTATEEPAQSEYLVIDLSAGPTAGSYPVGYLNAVPAGGWSDEYKTTKLVLRLVPAGTFSMGSSATELGHQEDESQHQVTITKGHYIGVFEVTQKQWERVMGDWPSFFSNTDVRDMRPVEGVNYNKIRGSNLGFGWPESSAVDGTSFIGVLRERTGLSALDLPTEAVWEQACRGGQTTALNSGQNLTALDTCPNLAALGRYAGNHPGGFSGNSAIGVEGGTPVVGSYTPNAYGLYDMHGGVAEWCLDWSDDYTGAAADPVGIPSADITSVVRVARGGSWRSEASLCRSAARGGSAPNSPFSFDIGLRICVPAQ